MKAPALVLALTLVSAFGATAAKAADHPADHKDVSDTKTAAPLDTIVDFAPLLDFSSLGKNAPGGFGAAVSGDRRLNEHWYASAETSVWSLDRSEDNVKDVQADGDDGDIVAKRQRSFALLGGARYYGNPEGRSWYAGVKTGYMTSNSTFAYKDARVDDRASGIPLVFEGGYRWYWGGGLTVRVGGHGGQTALFNRSVKARTGSDQETAEREVKGEGPDYRPNFDLAVGYAW